MIDLNKRAETAKHSHQEMERLINDFKPYLHSKASKFAQRDIFRREELYSTAMVAFYEAIKLYSAEKGHFFSFAKNVVRNHMVDHIRKIYKHEGNLVSLEAKKAEQLSNTIEKISINMFENERRRLCIDDELDQLKSELDAWGITLGSLAQKSPKHKKLAETIKNVVSQILQEPDIVQTIISKKYFPIKAISRISGLPTKKLERARTFILASIIIKTGDYEFLSEYVKNC